MAKLLLLRHGESTWNRENRFTGWTDVDLAPSGIEEARNAARALKAGGYDFDIAYTSVLKRAIRTRERAAHRVPEGHRGARAAVLERHDCARRARGQARADRGARQLAARAGEASRCDRRRRDRRAQYSDGHPTRLRARRRAASAQALLPGRCRRDRAAHRRRLGTGQGQSLTPLGSLVLAFAALAAQAAPGERDLAELRTRIGELQRELDEKGAERREARDALRASELAISEANRTLAALTLESNQLKAQSARLAERRRALERTLAERQGAVEAVLRARQGLGAPVLVRAALSGDDPAELARRLQYIAYLSRAAAELIATHRAELEALASLQHEA